MGAKELCKETGSRPANSGTCAPPSARLQALLILGHLAAWLAAGYVFRTLELGVHAVADSVAWIEQRPELVGGATPVVAGLFQFSSLKHRCLAACRSPRSFVYRYWRGGRCPRRL